MAENSTITGQFKCLDCDLTFGSERELQDHTLMHRMHPQEAIFTCPDCAARFEHEKEWKAHRALHNVLSE